MPQDRDPKTGRARITRRIRLPFLFNKSIIVRYQIIEIADGIHDDKIYTLQVDYTTLECKLGKLTVRMSRSQIFDFADEAQQFDFVGWAQVGKDWVKFYFDVYQCKRVPWFLDEFFQILPDGTLIVLDYPDKLPSDMARSRAKRQRVECGSG